MTPENQSIRDHLKSAENIIVSALAHQPEDSDECREYLLKAAKEVQSKLDAISIQVACNEGVKNALQNPSNVEPEPKEQEDKVCCYKCGGLTDIEDAELFFTSGGSRAYICRECAREERD